MVLALGGVSQPPWVGLWSRLISKLMLGILANLPYIANAIELRNGLNRIGLRQTMKNTLPRFDAD